MYRLGSEVAYDLVKQEMGRFTNVTILKSKEEE